jgi:hypothetical protein
VGDIWSRLRFVSARVAPSGAMSRSWKHQKGDSILTKNSKAASIRFLATEIGSLPDSQGRRIVPGPKGSLPTPRNACQ